MRLILSLLVIMTTLLPFKLSSNTTAATDYDLLIKHGRIIDGTGAASVIGDIGIKNERIAKIGNLANATATRTIDATRSVVAPGFIHMLCPSTTHPLIYP